MTTNYPWSMQNPYARYGLVPQEQQPIGLKGRPVSSVDEVRAISIDFDGSTFYFPDLANRHIYTKQINPDGTNTINTYELKPTPVPVNPYVTREEFNTALTQVLEKIQLPQAAETQTKSAPVPAETPATSEKPQFNF